MEEKALTREDLFDLYLEKLAENQSGYLDVSDLVGLDRKTYYYELLNIQREAIDLKITSEDYSDGILGGGRTYYDKGDQYHVFIENYGTYSKFRKEVRQESVTRREKLNTETKLLKKQNNWFYVVMTVGILGAVLSIVNFVILQSKDNQDIESVQQELDSLKTQMEEHTLILHQTNQDSL